MPELVTCGEAGPVLLAVQYGGFYRLAELLGKTFESVGKLTSQGKSILIQLKSWGAIVGITAMLKDVRLLPITEEGVLKKAVIVWLGALATNMP